MRKSSSLRKVVSAKRNLLCSNNTVVILLGATFTGFCCCPRSIFEVQNFVILSMSAVFASIFHLKTTAVHNFELSLRVPNAVKQVEFSVQSWKSNMTSLIGILFAINFMPSKRSRRGLYQGNQDLVSTPWYPNSLIPKVGLPEHPCILTV
jgi:hypothetical protein